MEQWAADLRVYLTINGTKTERRDSAVLDPSEMRFDGNVRFIGQNNNHNYLFKRIAKFKLFFEYFAVSVTAPTDNRTEVNPSILDCKYLLLTL